MAKALLKEEETAGKAALASARAELQRSLTPEQLTLLSGWLSETPEGSQIVKTYLSVPDEKEGDEVIDGTSQNDALHAVTVDKFDSPTLALPVADGALPIGKTVSLAPLSQPTGSWNAQFAAGGFDDDAFKASLTRGRSATDSNGEPSRTERMLMDMGFPEKTGRRQGLIVVRTHHAALRLFQSLAPIRTA